MAGLVCKVLTIMMRIVTTMSKLIKILTIALMTLSSLPSMSQIDLHSHAITQGYLAYIKANGAEMDEGFPIMSGRKILD